MISKGTRLYSILHHRCPQCHNGKLYLGKAYSKDFSKMPELCYHCGLRYEQECDHHRLSPNKDNTLLTNLHAPHDQSILE